MRETDPLLKNSNGLQDEEDMVICMEQQGKNYFSDDPNFLWIEISLLTNVFLSGFDGTITASTYSTIGNEFKALDLACWITSSYLITSTAFQPLYGSISDILGRRGCISFALVVFGLGCFGCYSATNMAVLIMMRALTGVGGGGLMSLSTITNSDIIYPEMRGMFQAIQNLMLGTGAVFGASFGGILTSYLGWRWCFAIQIFPTTLSLVVALMYISNRSEPEAVKESGGRIYNKIDFSGSVWLIISLTTQLLVLSLGGNQLSWANWRILVMCVVMVISTTYFVKVESSTPAIPIIPIKEYTTVFVIVNIALNFFIGLAAYSYLFTLPLLFQINLGDSTANAGLRLSIPAFATPVGGIISGYFMSKSKSFTNVALAGTILMTLGNYLGLLVSNGIPGWLTNILLVPANIGQGLVYPSALFSFIYHFEPHKQASSTSTVYLMRNIGGVWGVTYITTIVQSILGSNLQSHLSSLPNLSQDDIQNIIDTIVKSIDVLDTMDPEVREIVARDYTYALRVAQVISGSCCFLAIVCCFIGKKVKKVQGTP